MFSTKTEIGYEIEIPTSFKRYDIIEHIGYGSFSSVVKVQDKYTKKYFAAKIISKKDMENQNQMKTIMNEINVLKTISHPNIIEFNEIIEIKNERNGKEFAVIIEEYCENGCLLDYLNHNSLDEEDKKKIAFGLISSIEYLHKFNIAHCDIKLENVLLDKYLNPKLCDFGFAKNFNDIYDINKCGSIDYAAPELFKHGDVDFFKSDIWAFGISLYAIYELKFPFNNVYEVINGKLAIDSSNKSIYNIVKNCTNMDPEKRPSSEEIMNDDFIQILSR